MAKGTYVVGEGGDAPARDASYKSCLCALLIFISICVIVLLAGMRWTKDEIKKEVEDEIEQLGVKGGHAWTTEASTKPPTSPTRTRTVKPDPDPPTTEPGTTTTFSTSKTLKFVPTSHPRENEVIQKVYPFTTESTSTTTTTARNRSDAYEDLGNDINIGTERPDERNKTTTERLVGTIISTWVRSTEVQKVYPFTTQSTPTTVPYAARNGSDVYEDLGNDTEISTERSDGVKTTTGITIGIGLINETSTEAAIDDVAGDETSTGRPSGVTIDTETLVNVTIIKITNETSTEATMDDVTDDQTSMGRPSGLTVGTETPENVTSIKITNETSTTVKHDVTDVETGTARSNSTIGTEASNETSVEATSGAVLGIKIIDESSTEVADDNVTSVTTNLERSADNVTESGVALRTSTKAPNETANVTEYLLLAKLSTYTTTTEAKSVKPLETTNYNSTEGATTSTESPKLIFVPIVTEASTTVIADQTTRATTKVFDEQKRMVNDYNDYDAENETAEIIAVKRTTENAITNKVWSGHERTSPPPFRKPEPVCDTAECKSAASRMLSLMNHAADPCEDFYEFACGGMEADNADSDTWERLSGQLHLINKMAPPYLQTFKMFYDSCVSYEYEFDYQQRISKVLELVEEVGEIFDEEPPSGTFDMTELFAKLILRQSLPIMDVDVDIDKSTSKFILKLTLPKKTSILKESGRWSALSEGQKRCLDEQRHELQQRNLDLTKIHESYLTCQKNYAIYLNSIQTVVRALGFYSHLNDTFNQTQRIQDLRTTIEWDILEYLNTLPPPNDIRKTTLFKNYIVEKISDLQVHYPVLDWNRLFNILTGHELDSSTLIQVYFRDYFRELFQGLHLQNKWKINNALIAMYANDLYENLVIPQARHDREIYCLKLSSKLFHDVSNNMYMKTWNKAEMEDSQKFLTNIFNVLKEHLKSAFRKVDWLDDNSRISVISKANKIRLIFNKQEDLYNDETYLNLKYSNLALNTSEFQYNAVKMLKTSRNKLYALHGHPYSINYLWSYFLNGYDEAPTSFYSKFLIMAPLGMVKQPVKGFPEYVTMARIGLSLAREIGRHFDLVGIHNGMTLSEEAKPTYDSLQTIMENDALFNVQKSVGQQDVAFEADGKLSANERIADNTGLKLISDVFNHNGTLLPWISASASFSREKIFYITVAQEYCKKTDMSEYMQQLFESELLPASLRVENIMSNSDDFSGTFKCPVGSAMNNNPIKTQFPHLQKVEDYSEEEFQNIS